MTIYSIQTLYSLEIEFLVTMGTNELNISYMYVLHQYPNSPVWDL